MSDVTTTLQRLQLRRRRAARLPVTALTMLAGLSLLVVAAPDAMAGTATVAATTAASSSPGSYPVTHTQDGRTSTTLTNHAVPSKYRSGSSVTVVCQASGGTTYSGSKIWDLTSDHLWAVDWYVHTGYPGFSPKISRCSASKSFPVTVTSDGRTSKTVTNHAYPGRYRKGTSVALTCQAYGGATSTTTSLWDRTTDQLWVSDEDVHTGTNGLVTGLPRCDMDTSAGPADTGRNPANSLSLSVAGAGFIGTYEGFVATPYNDAAGHCTIGYGHLIHSASCTSADRATWGTLTKAQGTALLQKDANSFAGGIRSALGTTPLHQGEFDALVSFAYNIGLGGFHSSSVYGDLTGSPVDYAGVPTDLKKWSYAGGHFLCGLWRRRVNEGSLFSTGSYTITYPSCPSSAPSSAATRGGTGSGATVTTADTADTAAIAAGPRTPAALRPQASRSGR